MSNETLGDPNKSWWEARALVNSYISNTNPTIELSENEYNFEAALEKRLIESGKIHVFIRMAFSDDDFDLVNVEIIDAVNGFAKDFVQNERLKNE